MFSMNNNSLPYASSHGYGYSAQANIQTNTIFVTSLEEAIMQTTARPSDMVYFNQNGEYFYRVRVDVDGRKSWAQYKYSLPDQTIEAPVTRADILNLENRLKDIENKLQTKEVSVDAEKSS